jgi:hypothetical protein
MNLQLASPFRLTLVSLGIVALLSELGMSQIQPHSNRIDSSSLKTVSEQPAVSALNEPIVPSATAWCDGQLQRCPI